MDSGNSGSPQSSSGGDDDYDVFMNPHPPPRPSLFDPYTQQQIPSWPGSASIRSDPSPQLHTLIAPSFQPPQDGPENKNSNAGGASTPRNPRKRSRASRRAPTTVLTTDTTNFRAMVQEFTGIPAPPFSNQSFPRPHSLFGPSRSSARHPFSQAMPFLVPGSTPPIINYQQLPFPSNNNNNNNQNPFFSSLLQTNPSKFTSPMMPAGPGPEEFGLGGQGSDHHLHVTAPNELRNLIPSSDQGRGRDDGDDNGSAAKWRRHNDNESNGMGRGDGDQLMMMKPLNFGYDFCGEGSGSGSGLETRVGDQGMVESWINNSSE